MTTIALQKVESSQIDGIGYDPTQNRLAVQFKSKNGPGAIYEYENVDPATFAEFQSAESKGRFFGERIKPYKDKYPYRRVT
jgi:hypothetical protein